MELALEITIRCRGCPRLPRTPQVLQSSDSTARDGESVVAFDHMVSPESGQNDSSEASLKGKSQGLELEHFSTWEAKRIEELKKGSKREGKKMSHY